MGDVIQFLKPDVDNPPWNDETRAAIRERDRGCRAASFGLNTPCGEHWTNPHGFDVHHMLPRGRGGKNTPENLITLCPRHHRWVESHRDEAYELGLMVRSEHPAEAVPDLEEET